MGGLCSMHGEIGNVYKILVQKCEGKDLFEDLGIDRGIMLEWIFRK